MESERWQQIEELFNAALNLSPGDRESFLSSSCGADAELRDEVDSLLREVSRPNEFLSRSVFAAGTELLSRQASESLSGKHLGAYQIIRRIGRGGMGEVYLAEDKRLQRRVAIKLLSTSIFQNDDRIRRFKYESRAASAISHPNVAHIYEIGEAEGTLFMAMEFVDGRTLRQRLSIEGMKLKEVFDIMLQVVSGIAAAHSEGIVHRDIKPENIIIRRDGLVKVVDFGLAKLAARERNPDESASRETQHGGQVTQMIHTEPGLLMGTAGYMSPEQARGQEVDTRTDIWSLGVVFYEMLVGKLPFTGATNSDVIAEILKSEPALFRTDAEIFPLSVIEILRRTLAKDREHRYPSAREIALTLKEVGEQLGVAGLAEATVPFRLNDEEPSADSAGSSLRSSKELQSQTSRIQEVASTPIRGAARRGLLRSPVVILLAGIMIIALSLVFSGLIRKRFKTNGALEIIHLTSDGRVMDAAISQDGHLLAYVPIEAGKQSLRVRNLESGENWELLPPDPAFYWGMRFAANNQTIFYVTKQPGSTISVLYRMPVRGGTSQKLIVNIDSPPGLSPDGMQIAFVRGYPGQHRDALIVANVDGSAEREVLSRAHPDKLSMSGIAWSPDAKLIAAGASRRDETEVAVLGVPVNGGAPIELTPWKWSKVLGVVWKNDGSAILFSAQTPGNNALQIWRVSYPTKEIHSVTNDDKEYEEATLGPNVLVATHTYEVSDLWSSEQAGTHRITEDGHNGADGLTMTATGRIVYTVGEYSASQLWSMNLDGSDRRLLTRNFGALPTASQNGQLIAYVSAQGGAHHIWLISADGRNDRQLTFGVGENYPSITPDGKWVLYVSRAMERGTLFKTATTGGQPVQLTFAGIIVNPVVSPDGTMIACTFRTDEADRWKIAVLPIDGGSPIKTFAVPDPFNQIIRWTADSKAVTYLDRVNGAQNVWRQPLDSSPATKITNFREDSILHYDWSGQQLILARGGRRRDIVLMKNVD